MTDDEKLAIFDRASITDEFIDDADRRIETGEFFEGSWTTVESHEPVIVPVETER